jgi:methylmalonyl-CoA mutase cobalamin-binding subunit
MVRTSDSQVIGKAREQAVKTAGICRQSSGHRAEAPMLMTELPNNLDASALENLRSTVAF